MDFVLFHYLIPSFKWTEQPDISLLLQKGKRAPPENGIRIAVQNQFLGGYEVSLNYDL